MIDAFISHASADVATALQAEQLLEKQGLAIWLDRSEIRLGTLLRKELQTAIGDARVLVLLWSKTAAKSHWVIAELLTAFHLDRFIVPCSLDKTKLPYFLQNSIHLNLTLAHTDWLDPLRRAIAESPASANDVPLMMASQDADLKSAIRGIAEGQQAVLEQLGARELDKAKAIQPLVGQAMALAEKQWPLEPMILDLAGYQRKNDYMLKYWAALQAGRPPKDRLLDRAQHCFYEALLVDPNDVTALNGLGSTLILSRDIDAAEFFVRRAIALGRKQGIDYSAAKQDLAMIEAFRRRHGAE